MDENKIIQMHPTETFPDKIDEEQTFRKSDKGGGNNMNKYVTHEELDHVVDRLSDKIDLMESHIDAKFEQVNTKFANQKVWFYGTAISIIVATIAIVKFFH
ncbi:hypothetical protein [Secundilactobacillus kimchicus]|uniref:hypothetical protein n=1 Tax=Secundilactobacillus kimchicus TaxID=528209 RepID=UPI0024A9ED09|nr:hypothetical protein [Secundilactobacillus kimchicus]